MGGAVLAPKQENQVRIWKNKPYPETSFCQISQGDGNVLYLDWGARYVDIVISQKSGNYTLTVCML